MSNVKGRGFSSGVLKRRSKKSLARRALIRGSLGVPLRGTPRATSLGASKGASRGARGTRRDEQFAPSMEERADAMEKWRVETRAASMAASMDVPRPLMDTLTADPSMDVRPSRGALRGALRGSSRGSSRAASIAASRALSRAQSIRAQSIASRAGGRGVSRGTSRGILRRSLGGPVVDQPGGQFVDQSRGGAMGGSPRGGLRGSRNSLRDAVGAQRRSRSASRDDSMGVFRGSPRGALRGSHIRALMGSPRGVLRGSPRGAFRGSSRGAPLDSTRMGVREGNLSEEVWFDSDYHFAEEQFNASDRMSNAGNRFGDECLDRNINPGYVQFNEEPMYVEQFQVETPVHKQFKQLMPEERSDADIALSRRLKQRPVSVNANLPPARKQVTRRKSLGEANWNEEQFDRSVAATRNRNPPMSGKEHFNMNIAPSRNRKQLNQPMSGEEHFNTDIGPSRNNSKKLNQPMSVKEQFDADVARSMRNQFNRPRTGEGRFNRNVVPSREQNQPRHDVEQFDINVKQSNTPIMDRGFSKPSIIDRGFNLSSLSGGIPKKSGGGSLNRSNISDGEPPNTRRQSGRGRNATSRSSRDRFDTSIDFDRGANTNNTSAGRTVNKINGSGGTQYSNAESAHDRGEFNVNIESSRSRKATKPAGRRVNTDNISDKSRQNTTDTSFETDNSSRRNRSNEPGRRSVADQRFNTSNRSARNRQHAADNTHGVGSGSYVDVDNIPAEERFNTNNTSGPRGIRNSIPTKAPAEGRKFNANNKTDGDIFEITISNNKRNRPAGGNFQRQNNNSNNNSNSNNKNRESFNASNRQVNTSNSGRRRLTALELANQVMEMEEVQQPAAKQQQRPAVDMASQALQQAQWNNTYNYQQNAAAYTYTVQQHQQVHQQVVYNNNHQAQQYQAANTAAASHDNDTRYQDPWRK